MPVDKNKITDLKASAAPLEKTLEAPAEVKKEEPKKKRGLKFLFKKEEDNPYGRSKELQKYLNEKMPKGQYNKYSGIVDEKGKRIDNPTRIQSMRNMIQYLNHNTPESNVYRAEHAHTSINYNRKKINPDV